MPFASNFMLRPADPAVTNLSTDVGRVVTGRHMASGDFVSYLRVSTQKQGASGLGLEAQRTAVAGYLNGGQWRIAREFVEVESGRKSDRPKLDEALAFARVRKLPLIVAKVDRLTRSVAFLSKLQEAGVDVRFADLPQIEGPTGKFMLQQMAAVAELEAGLISARTKAALAAAKARNVKLGGNRGVVPTDETRAKAAAGWKEKVSKDAAGLKPEIDRLRAAGAKSLRDIAAGLNEAGIPTARGGKWSAVQIQRVLSRLNAG